MARRLVVALLSAYLLVFLALTLAYSNTAIDENYPARHRISLRPFRSIARDLASGGDGLVVNLVGNVVVTLPLGASILVLAGAKARLRHAAAAGFVLSAMIESLQFGTGRRFTDVDDVILNTTGAVLGFLAAAAVRRARRKPIDQS